MTTSNFLDEQSLVAACLTGDPTAWSTLVDRYGRLVFSIGRRYGLSPGDTEDVFQLVFETAFKHLSSLKNPAALSGWIATITHHECQHLLSRSRPDLELQDTFHDHAPQLEEIAIFRERQLMVHDALSQLEPRCRRLLVALFLQEETIGYEALAAQLDMPVGAIGPNRIRCLAKLEKIIAGMERRSAK